VSRPAAKARVLLIDDHPVLREGLAGRLNRESDLTVCVEAASAGDALRTVTRCRPDIVVLDLALPGYHGFEVIKELRAVQPRLPILVFTMHEEALYAERALRAGARGYVTKQEPPERLLAAIRAVLAGDYAVSGKMSAAVMRSLLAPAATAPTVTNLSDRELEIFQLLGRGVGTKEVAARLHRSVKTVETHRARIKEKLQLKTAPELVQRAVRWTETGQ
jgi:DNA-binding NarL/FixJ family response regulator